MSAVQLLAAAVMVIGLCAIALAASLILFHRRLTSLAALTVKFADRVKLLEADSHTHDFLGSKPKLAQGGIVTGRTAIVGDDGCVIPAPSAARSHISNQHTTPPTVIPSAPTPGSGRPGPWDGQGYHS